jgi:sulfur-carrier protein adenylyltransferase/sulfurtransferase
MLPELTSPEYQRYSRHLMIPEVGVIGQRKLKNSSVLIVGTGGLGSPVALYLAAAGVGRIGLVDYDVVDSSNLQRQIVHGSSTIDQLKVESAKKRLQDLNPFIQIDAINQVLSSENALQIAGDYQILVDGTDNFPTRYLLNDLAVFTGKPYVYGSIFRFEGQVSVFDARSGPCYRCLFPEPPPPGLIPSCSQAGVFGVLPGTIGTLQATEVIKLILGIGEPLIGRLMLYDAMESSLQPIRLRKNPACKVCGSHPEITQLLDYDAYCGVPARDRPEYHHTDFDVTALDLANRKKNGEPFQWIDVREPVELQISQIPGAVNIPLGELAQRLAELDPSATQVVFCRTGVRSERALGVLRAAGFEHALNLRGGINAWVQQEDPDQPLY